MDNVASVLGLFSPGACVSGAQHVLRGCRKLICLVPRLCVKIRDWLCCFCWEGWILCFLVLDAMRTEDKEEHDPRV